MSADQTNFVCCIESGTLETMCVRMIASLRRFGGRFAHSPVTAVISRMGPRLAKTTTRALAELDARVIRLPMRRPYAWYHFTNKPAALAAVEEITDSRQIVCLDSDLLIMSEPRELLLDDQTDFAACAPDLGVIGTTGSTSPDEPHWRHICQLLGISVEDLPWITTADAHRIRFYWNSGVWSYKRSTRLGREYWNTCRQLLDARAGFPRFGEHWIEQMSLGLAAFRNKLTWRALPLSHNHTMLRTTDDAGLGAVSILHYHDCMKPDFWPQLLGRLRAHRPDVCEWLQTLGPIENPAARLSRAVSQCLRLGRGLPRKLYRRRMKLPAPIDRVSNAPAGMMCAAEGSA
jgi:hypothetical protein